MSQKCFPPPSPLEVPGPIPGPSGWKIAKWMTMKIAELIIGDKHADDDDD